MCYHYYLWIFFLSKKIVTTNCIWSLTKCYWMFSWKFCLKFSNAWIWKMFHCSLLPATNTAAWSEALWHSSFPFSVICESGPKFKVLCVTKCLFFFQLSFKSKWFDRTKPGRPSDCEAKSGQIVELCHGMQWEPKTLTSSALTLWKKQL